MNYFKQYGEMRTGTNYLKRLLEINYLDVTVYGSILGWKHGTYDTGNAIDDTSSHLEWLDRKTKNNIVYSVDNIPLVKHDYDTLKSSIDKLKYIFSIKRPVPFVLSFKKFRFPNRPLTKQIILNLCKRYNEKYNNWMQMYELNGGTFVSYESLLHDYKHVLFNLEIKYKLVRLNEKLRDEKRPVKASTDVGLIIDRKSTFNKDYYLHELYLNDISNEHANIINDNIDHDLVDLIYKLSV